MMRAVALATLLSISSAPFQCGGGNAPAREETAGDALWALSEEREAKGDHAGAQQTLEFLVRKYPSSRYAEEAKRKLAGADGG